MAYSNLIIAATQAALAELHHQADSVENLYIDPVMTPGRGLLIDGDIDLYRLVIAVKNILQARRRLPPRRENQTINFTHGSMDYTAQVSFFPNGDPAEIFLRAGKIGTDVYVTARDAGIAASLCLQYRCPIKVLLSALTKSASPMTAGGPLPDMIHDGPLGVAITKIMEDL